MKTVVEVNKALDKCFFSLGCQDCPYEDLDSESCLKTAVSDAINILTKLQSENESLKAELGAAQQAINSMKGKLRAAGLYYG